ncbi:MAG TPA: hypothetical protein VET23_13670, partial [Chitinophagaceae bacterium]|nr:hypothetical protein [Chitinophagaceae bacterium]
MKQTIAYKIKAATQSFGLMSFLWLLFMILLSIYEVLINGITHQFFKDTVTVLGANIINTISFWLKCNLILYFLFVVIYFVSSKLSRWVFYIFSTLLLLIHIGLIQYSVIAMVPLGADFYDYSAADMKQTVGASGGISFSTILTFVLFLVAYIFILYKFRKQNNMRPKIAVAFRLVSVIFLLSGFSSSNAYLSLKTEYSRNLALNKSDFFFKQSYSHFFPAIIDDDIYSDSYSGDFGNGETKMTNFVYIDEQKYPFLHTDATADVLSPFFKKSDKSPNIVILLV